MEEEPAARRPRRACGEPSGREPRGRRRRLLVGVGWVVAVALGFVVGLAVGRAVEDAPRPGGEQTIVRTLVPATIGPAERTVTVTVATAP